MNAEKEFLDVLLNMSKNILKLAQMVAALQKQVNALEKRVCEDDLK